MRAITGIHHPELLLRLEIHNTERVTDAGLEMLAVFHNLRSLTVAGCHHISIAGLRHIRSLEKLAFLYLGATSITGDTLKEFGTLDRLKTLGIGYNRITDSALGELRGGFKSLEYLWIEHTPITDVSLEHLKVLPSLRVVHAESTKITAVGVRQFNEARPDVKVVWREEAVSNPKRPAKPDSTAKASTDPKPAPARVMSPNRLAAQTILKYGGWFESAEPKQTVRTMEEWEKLPESFPISAIEIGDYATPSVLTEENLAVITGMGQPDHVTRLKLHNVPNITDGGLVHVLRLRSLENLELGNTAITDDGLKKLTALPLHALCCQKCKFSNRGMKYIHRFAKLEYLSLAGTSITDLRELDAIKALWAEGTQITDASLEQLDDNFKLEHLWLSGTPITDAGLDHLKVLPSLREVHVEGTKITAVGVRRFNEARPEVKVVWEKPKPEK